jgi:HPt (histidine-containing phosphotransfer) domain-containing protein
MDDCIAKPVVESRLKAILDRVLARDSVRSGYVTPLREAHTSPGAGGERSAPTAFDTPDAGGEALVCDSAVMARFGEDFGLATVPRLVATFLDDIRAKQESLADAVAADNIAEVQRLCHQLKSTAGSYGAERLRLLATAANDAAVGGRGQEAMSHARRVLDTLPATIAAFERLPTEIGAHGESGGAIG